ncbi:MAG: MmpS family transport accessory protein [Segniliparus sp.]|uniref:MmpS family transport accessory protein n=1 Tax=Segniliparus sp. TaxID=2804064 RepID=UPI003F31011B
MHMSALAKTVLIGAAALPLALPASFASAAPVTVAYQVVGSGKATELVYWDETGTKQTETNVPLPWSKTVAIPKTIPIHLNVVVPNGEVTCKIAVDGKPTSEIKGKYSARCSTDITGS